MSVQCFVVSNKIDITTLFLPPDLAIEKKYIRNYSEERPEQKKTVPLNPLINYILHNKKTINVNNVKEWDRKKNGRNCVYVLFDRYIYCTWNFINRLPIFLQPKKTSNNNSTRFCVQCFRSSIPLHTNNSASDLWMKPISNNLIETKLSDIFFRLLTRSPCEK